MKRYSRPTTLLYDYLEYRKEVNEQLNLAMARHSAGLPVSLEDLKEKIDGIYNKYCHLLNLNDVYSFDSLGELECFVYNIDGVDKSMIPEAINHERAHAEKAIELGYEIKGFSCVCLLDNNEGITYAVRTSLKTDSLIPYENFIKIALASDNPSFSDEYH